MIKGKKGKKKEKRRKIVCLKIDVEKKEKK